MTYRVILTTTAMQAIEVHARYIAETGLAPETAARWLER